MQMLCQFITSTFTQTRYAVFILTYIDTYRRKFQEGTTGHEERTETLAYVCTL